MEELVSIILPIYNAEKYLERCLESIITQTYANIEIILINDGSTDNSINIIKEYAIKDSRIIIIDKENEGVSVARNIGILKARGKYICFVDADDYIEKSMIEKMKCCIDKENVDLVRINYYNIMTNGKKIKGNIEKYANRIFKKDEIKSELIEGIISGEFPAFVYLLMIKRGKINAMFPKDISYMEDTIFCIDLFLNCNSIYFLDETLYYYNLNEGSATQNPKNLEKNINAIILVRDSIIKIMEKYNIKNPNIIYILKNTLCRRTIDFIYLMYWNKQNFLSIINNDNILNIIKEGDSKSLPIYNRIAQKLICNKKISKLKIIFFMRKQANKILNNN